MAMPRTGEHAIGSSSESPSQRVNLNGEKTGRRRRGNGEKRAAIPPAAHSAKRAADVAADPDPGSLRSACGRRSSPSTRRAIARPYPCADTAGGSGRNVSGRTSDGGSALPRGGVRHLRAVGVWRMVCQAPRPRVLQLGRRRSQLSLSRRARRLLLVRAHGMGWL